MLGQSFTNSILSSLFPVLSSLPQRRSDSARWILSQSLERVMGPTEVSGVQRQALKQTGHRKEKPWVRRLCWEGPEEGRQASYYPAYTAGNLGTTAQGLGHTADVLWLPARARTPRQEPGQNSSCCCLEFITTTRGTAGTLPP